MMRSHKTALTALWLACACAAPPAWALAADSALPEPTFVVSFDGSAEPQVMAGRHDHPAATTGGVPYVEGRTGQAVLIGAGPILVYHAEGNVPDVATVTFWMKPIDWQPLDAWRHVMVIRAAGRSTMLLSHYPKHGPRLRFNWSMFTDPKHEGTRADLVMDQWNHVAIAWDGIRSRVYFNGDLVLARNHPAGFRPAIPAITTLHLGGIEKHGGRGLNRDPWGEADTAIDDLRVFPGMLGPVQIAALAGKTRAVRPREGPAGQPPMLDVPRLRDPPAIDGRLDDGEWDGATTLANLIDAHDPGRSFDYPRQRVHFAYDDENLYVAMRSHFPLGASVLEAPARRGLDHPDVEVWGSESFEIWLQKPADASLYRFAGSPGGGFTERHAMDDAWNGRWSYETSMGMTIVSSQYWDVEVAIPFKTLGITSPDTTTLQLNFARTWRCLDKVGVTSWIGSGSYGDAKRLGTARFTRAAPACAIADEGSPATGSLTRTFTFSNGGVDPFRGTLEVRLQADLAENDHVVRQARVEIEPGENVRIACPIAIKDTMFHRLQHTLTRDGEAEPALRHSVPFALRTDYLDIVPLNLQHKLVIRPACDLYRGRLRSLGAEAVTVHVRVQGPEGREIASRQVASDESISVALSPDGPWGEYRVSLFGLDAQGAAIEPNERRFQRPPTPDWLTAANDDPDHVPAPFTPLEAGVDGGVVSLSCFGRTYRYERGLFPMAIRTGGIDDILQAPIAVEVDGADLGPASLAVKRASEARADLQASAETDRVAVTSTFWVEYDGLIYNTVTFHAKANVRAIDLRVPMQADHARYAHMCGSGFGGSGGKTRALEGDIASGFRPVVWIGDFERGLCWFAEGRGDLQTGAREPITIVRADGATVLRVRLVDDLAAGATATVRFGLLATPVKPLHPRYPLNIYAGMPSIFAQPPARPLHSRVTWGEERGFWDFRIYDSRRKAWRDPGKDLAASVRSALPGIVIPYMTPYTVPSDYPEANHYVREWEILPARHWERPGGRALPDGGARDYVCYFMSPAAESYRKYYAHRVADMIARTGLHGLYFDFGVALRDGNGHHGARGGLCMLGLRDFYRRMAREFLKAGIEDYVIVVHNSMAMQIPALTHVTHFFNGEQHRHASGSTLHGGRDYLDTLPLHYFGIEHSGLPWGIHGNMLPEFPEAEHLLTRDGVKDETVTEYLWDRTPSVMMPILLHNCLPGGYRLSHYYYKVVYGVLEDFDVPTATFHPYWRNQEHVEVTHPDFRVSLYARPEAPRALLVVGNLGKAPAETTISLDMRRLYDWRKARGGLARVKKRGEILQAVERIGARDARILGVGPNDIRLRVKGHGMALVEVAGHQRLR